MQEEIVDVIIKQRKLLKPETSENKATKSTDTFPLFTPLKLKKVKRMLCVTSKEA